MMKSIIIKIISEKDFNYKMNMLEYLYGLFFNEIIFKKVVNHLIKDFNLCLDVIKEIINE